MLRIFGKLFEELDLQSSHHFLKIKLKTRTDEYITDIRSIQRDSKFTLQQFYHMNI